MNYEFIGTLLIGIAGGGGTAAAINWWSDRPKVEAESKNLLVESTKLLLAPLNERIENQSERIDVLEDQVAHLEEVERKHIALAIEKGFWPPTEEEWEAL